MNIKNGLTLDLLNELFEIKDSKLVWKVNRGTNKVKGVDAGYVHPSGYLVVKINGDKYQSHRLLYMLYHNTEIPEGLQIDHIDGDRLNNSRDNLRLVTHQENHFNRTKAKGYCWSKQNNKWMAYIALDGKTKHLGSYDNEEDARDAYLKAKDELHIIEER